MTVSFLSRMRGIARVTVHDWTHCRDSLRKDGQRPLGKAEHLLEVSLLSGIAAKLQGAHVNVVRITSFHDAVTRTAVVFVMNVTRTTGLDVTTSRKEASPACRRPSCGCLCKQAAGSPLGPVTADQSAGYGRLRSAKNSRIQAPMYGLL